MSVFRMSASESRPLSSLSRNSFESFATGWLVGALYILPERYAPILAISTRCCTPSHNTKMSFDVSHETMIATRTTIKTLKACGGVGETEAY